VIAPVVEQATAPVQPIVTTVETTLEPLVPGTETVERVAESVVDDLESIVDPVSPISLPSLAAPTPALTHEPKAADPPAPSADESDTVSESHGPDKNVDVLADTTALVDVAPALVIPVVATLDIHAAATTPSASASANAAVTQPHTKGQTAFVEPTAPTAAPQTSPSLVDSLANLMALQTPDADLSSPDVAAIMLGPARLTSVGLLDRMVSLEATSLKATPIGGSHQPMPPPLPVPQSALPPPVSAPASLLLGTAGSAGAAPPILAFLSLAAAWHTLWLVAGVRPAGITLPSLAPPG